MMTGEADNMYESQKKDSMAKNPNTETTTQCPFQNNLLLLQIRWLAPASSANDQHMFGIFSSELIFLH